MKKYLENNGIESKKIYILELFDYLIENNVKRQHKNVPILELDYVGNLVEEKCPFIYKLNDKYEFILNLYGSGIDGDINDNTKYYGVFKPDQLPNKLNGNFGLVWDGQCDESDEEVSYKNYTKYNNPHKLSCYIAAGLPVIVWKKSAIAELVIKYNIGYLINSLEEIKKLDISDYYEKEKNVKELSLKVTNGYFTKKVFNNIILDIDKIGR